MKTRLAALFCLCLSSTAWADDTPRAGWYATRTEISLDGKTWRELPAPQQGLCVLGLKAAELEQIYRASFERDGCTVSSLHIGGGSGKGLAVCSVQGRPMHMQISGSYGSEHFKTLADGQGVLVVEKNASLPFHARSRSEGQRQRDCSAAELAQSRKALSSGG